MQILYRKCVRQSVQKEIIKILFINISIITIAHNAATAALLEKLRFLVCLRKCGTLVTEAVIFLDRIEKIITGLHVNGARAAGDIL